jgi:DNA-binding MarR family transcriptional regulator
MLLAEHARERRSVTQQELGRGLGIDKSNVARLSARMERAGHVKQDRSADDGRARLVSLTRAGIKVAESVEQSSHERFGRILEALQADGREAVLAALAQLNAAVSSLTTPEGEAPPPASATPERPSKSRSGPRRFGRTQRHRETSAQESS